MMYAGVQSPDFGRLHRQQLAGVAMPCRKRHRARCQSQQNVPLPSITAQQSSANHLSLDMQTAPIQGCNTTINYVHADSSKEVEGAAGPRLDRPESC